MALKHLTLLPLAASLVLMPLSGQTRDRITRGIDNRETVRLTGNVHPLARPEFDRGAVPADLAMDRMILVLSADAAQQTELDELVEAEQNPASPLYHHWITPEEYGSRFGISAHDLNQIQGWLIGQGLRVEEIPAGLRTIVSAGRRVRWGRHFTPKSTLTR